MASVFILFVALVFLLFFYRSLPPFIPVFNQLPWGEERLGDKLTIFIPLAIASTMLIGNMIFSQALYDKMPLVVRMISITTFFISFITLIFIIKTTQLLL